MYTYTTITLFLTLIVFGYYTYRYYRRLPIAFRYSIWAEIIMLNTVVCLFILFILLVLGKV